MTDEKSSAPIRSWRPRHVSLLTIVLALLAVISFFAVAGKGERYGGYGGGIPVLPTGVAVNSSYQDIDQGAAEKATDISVSTPPPSLQGAITGQSGRASAGYAYPSDYYPYPNPDAPATDTRELLKVNYSAAMRTRDVPGLVRRVETTVRGHGGRVDQESSSPQSRYVGFVVPMSKYDAFRSELEAMVNDRFLTVNISSSNMLPQKVSIEEYQKQASSTLTDYQTSRKKLISSHASTVASLQSQIDSDANQMALLRAQTQTSDIQYQLQRLTDEWSSLKQQLINENSSYKYQLDTIDSNIKYTKDWQKSIGKQDQALLDNVATVNGTVSISWISLWDMAQAYLPGYWIPAIFALLTILSFLWDRRRFGTV